MNARRAELASEAWSKNDPPQYAWVLDQVRRLPKPVPYEHPRGAVIWVTLPDTIRRRLGL